MRPQAAKPLPSVLGLRVYVERHYCAGCGHHEAIHPKRGGCEGRLGDLRGCVCTVFRRVVKLAR